MEEEINVIEKDYKQQYGKEEIDLVLEKLCKTNKSWLCLIFILTASPGVLNGMHIMSYIFFVDNEPHYCNIPSLEKAGWTANEIMNISLVKTESPSEYGCLYYDYQYSIIANNSFEWALAYTNSMKEKPKTLPCNDYRYQNINSVVSEWNLVCDHFYYRSNIQAAYAVGKFFGASIFGVIADKYGRKLSFTSAAICFTFSALLAAFSNSFGVFLVIRFLIGFGGVGCYGTAYTLLSELIVGQAKTWICCTFNISYAIGMIILSCLAYHIQYWKSLLIIISSPTFILIFYYWLLPESPQWLLSKNKYNEAWKVLQKMDSTVKLKDESLQVLHKFKDNCNRRIYTVKKLIKPFIELGSVFSTPTLTLRTMICFFIWFTVSSTYIGLAINGENFMVNRYTYLALNGILEIFSYLLPGPLLIVFGRKSACMLLFSLTGILLISIMFVPKVYKITILILALFGRFCSTSAYVIFALYTSELFPTSIRNTAIGISLTMSHLGTFISPYIVDILGTHSWYLPSSIFGLLSVCSIFLLIFLPETKDKPLLNTIEEMISEKI